MLLRPVTSMKQPLQQRETPENVPVSFASLRLLLLLHLTCGLSLALAFWVAFTFCSLTLIQSPAETLFVIWVVEALVLIPVFSQFHCNPDKCSYVKAMARGLICLPAGALVNALGAIVLGAPVGTQNFKKTVNWSLLMSVFTVCIPLRDHFLLQMFYLSVLAYRIVDLFGASCFISAPIFLASTLFVPAASVFGSSWTDWHRIFAHSKPMGPIDFIICLPAHGAVIGAWFGAWPMPLDWERPWQEWPICVTYGAALGYLIGVMVSFVFVVHQSRQRHGKSD